MQEQTKAISVGQYLANPSVQKKIENVLGERKNQFVTSVASLVASNKALENVDKGTLFSACLTAAALDLPINQNLGFAYIIPYKNKSGIQQAQFQLGYKGFIQLAQRSGQFKTINVSDVREGEISSQDRLTGEITFEWAEDRSNLPIIGYVGYMKLINGFEKSLYLTKEDLTKHATRYSQSFKRNSPNMNIWKDNFEAMAFKTVIKMLLSKYGPLSIDMQQAQLADQAVVTDEGFEYPDNEPIVPEALAEEKERERILTHIENVESIEDLKKCEAAVYDSQDLDLVNTYELKRAELSK